MTRPDLEGSAEERWSISPEENERRDQELLRRGAVSFRVAILDRPALSVGVAVPADATCVERARASGLPIVQRSTGGTAVLFGEGDLVWAVVLPRGVPLLGRKLSDAYARLGAPLLTVLAGHGVEASWDPAPSLSRECCLLGERGHVLQHGGRVLSGAAQHLTQRALLHHGTFPRRVDRETHRAIFPGDDPRIFDRLMGTEDAGVEEEPEELREELVRAFGLLLPAR